MNLSITIFTIGILGFLTNRKHLILLLISIELILLSVTLLILINSYIYDDIMGQLYSIFIISIAGSESAIGLGIIIAYYRLRGTISLDSNK